MSDIFKEAQKPKKRDWFDWLGDNFGKVMIGFILFFVASTSLSLYWVALHQHEILSSFGAAAKDVVNGYNGKQK